MILTRPFRFARKVLRKIFFLYKHSGLRNHDFTVISKDCTGGILLHELHQKFDTPTINACFHAGDFVKFCRDLEYYLSCEMAHDKVNSAKMGYPVGILGNNGREIRVWFMHDYADFHEAKAKWEERSKRIHLDNIYFIMTDGKGCNEELAREFDSLPSKHKALLTYKEYDGISSAVKLKPIKLAEYGLGAPEVLAFKSMFSVKRVVDDWDYVGFLNS